MIIFLVILAVLVICSIEFATPKRLPEGATVFNDYLSKENTACVKGIFIILVVLGHIYLKLQFSNSILNSSYYFFYYNFIGQSVVSMFMFYSGWAMMLNCTKKEGYIKTIPVKRVLKLLFNFAIIATVYIVVYILKGNNLSVSDIILTLIGLSRKTGISSWYIFVILCLYTLTYISFKVIKNNKWLSFALFTLLAVILIVALSRFKDRYWWDTILCYVFGMLYFLLNDKINSIMNNKKYFLLSYLSVGFVLCVLLFLNLKFSFVVFEVFKHIVFAAFIVLTTMKIKLKSKILKFAGDNLFYIYTLHMLPVIFVANTPIASNPFVAVPVIFTVVALLIVPVKYVIEKLDTLAFKSKNA